MTTTRRPIRIPLRKRLFDLALSVPLVIALAPVMALVALVIRLAEGQPVLFRQPRPGLGGKVFTVFKFRTMRNASTPDGTALPDAARLSRLGRFLRATSLDELPELVNVLRGEMGLVGPRPLAREEMGFNALWMQTRLSVKPGMTGLWQIKGRASRQFSDWVRYDIEYVQNWSLLGDLKILLLTIPVVARRRGAL